MSRFLIKFTVNGIFVAVFFVSALLFLCFDPNGFLPALLAGAEKAGALSLSLLAVYCVWLGFFKVLEESGLSGKLSRAVFPLAKRLFRSDDREALFYASGNLSANLLGLPGAPTPLGVKAVEKFYAAQNRYAADMLFVLNATSLQLLPTTVIALRLAAGSLNASDILLPTLIATLFSSFAGITLMLLYAKLHKRRKKR